MRRHRNNKEISDKKMKVDEGCEIQGSISINVQKRIWQPSYMIQCFECLYELQWIDKLVIFYKEYIKNKNSSDICML